eukprot:TRINITY_DN7671_c0_g1_i1.p1 TRINITY_DN7671_c0_g1~~TRINITY_DN7671_c0_g1_i1.p1  ORF type:complete len:768 (-),score=238.64 TRINITY_DN7671_c0_g1_i1:2-2149(-)
MRMVLDNPGTWLAHCHNNFHLVAGMVFVFTITGEAPPPRSPGRVRDYYVALEEGVWEYVAANGSCVPPTAAARAYTDTNVPVGAAPGGVTLGSAYVKSRYVEYTDASFATPVGRSAEWAHLGLTGPLLRTAVGETVRVTFLNRGSHPASLHPHGLWYDKASEGAPYVDGSAAAERGDDAVEPASTHVYEWQVPARAGPGPGEGDGGVKMWAYHSHTDEVRDTNAGLVGALTVAAPAADGSRSYDAETLVPTDVERELVFFYSVLNENTGTGSVHAGTNLLRNPALAALSPAARAAVASDGAFRASNLMHSINGYSFCSLPPTTVSHGQRVRLYFLSLGSTVDIHTPAFGTGGQRQDETGEVVPVGRLMPGAFYAAVTTINSRGPFEIACFFVDHLRAGMVAMINVAPGSGEPPPPGDAALCTAPVDAERDERRRLYTHYIATEEVEWDYSPARRQCNRRRLSAAQQAIITPTATSPGSRFLKARFQEFTDGTFATPLRLRQPVSHGLLGPLLHVEAGDTLRVVLRNTGVAFHTTFIVPGLDLVCTAKAGGPSVPTFQATAAGETVTIVYRVPASAAPSAAPARSPPAPGSAPGLTTSSTAVQALSPPPAGATRASWPLSPSPAGGASPPTAATRPTSPPLWPSPCRSSMRGGARTSTPASTATPTRPCPPAAACSAPRSAATCGAAARRCASARAPAPACMWPRGGAETAKAHRG